MGNRIGFDKDKFIRWNENVEALLMDCFGVTSILEYMDDTTQMDRFDERMGARDSARKIIEENLSSIMGVYPESIVQDALADLA